jgi:hypothetical protein
VPFRMVPTPEFHSTVSARWEFVIDFSRYPIGTRLVMVNKLVDPSDTRLFQIIATRVDIDDILRGTRANANARKVSHRHFEVSVWQSTRRQSGLVTFGSALPM